MFAALQRATKSTEEYLRLSALNWVSSSPVSPAPKLDVHQESPSLGNALQVDCISSENGPQWVDIPLSDEDEQLSPRGVLEFRRNSESESACTQITGAVTPRTNGLTLFFDPPAIRRRRRSTSSTQCSDRSSPIFTAKKEDYDVSPTLANWKTSVSSTLDDFSSKPHESTTLADQGFGPIKRTLTKSGICEDSNTSRHAGTQTPKESEDLANTTAALQHRLADALNALNLTRNQADALRDRLRTYTSGMKQQTDDLRACSRTLSNALDKAREYKIQWKNESTLKEEAKKKVYELDQNVKSLQKTLGQRDSEMKIFHQGIDTLNILLGVNTHDTDEAKEKLNSTSKKVKDLLDLVERMQTDATMNSMISMVEFKESVRKFEEEKASWISFTKRNEDALSGKINRLEYDNNMLRAKLEKVQQSSSEIKALWSQSKRECAEKDAKLEQSRQTICNFQAELTIAETRLQKSITGRENEIKDKAELKATFMRQNLKLEQEKRLIESGLTELKKEAESKKMNMRDQATLCTGLFEELSRDGSVPTPNSFFRSVNADSDIKFHENEESRKSLKEEIQNLKQSIIDMRKNFIDTEEDCVRLRGDVRQLRWICHHQEVTVQTVRAENRALRISISKQKRGRESFDNEQNIENTIHTPQHGRSNSGSGSESERVRLQTILESSDEKSSSVGSNPRNCRSSSLGSIPSSKVSDVPSPTVSVSSDLIDRNIKQLPGDIISLNLNGEVPNANTTSIHDRSSSSFSHDGDVQSSAKRKRKSKRNSTSNSKLPIWRQENPNNLYSMNMGLRDRSDSDSTESEDVFIASGDSTRFSASTGIRAFKRHSDSPYQKGRLLAIPMTEKEFTRLVGSLNYDNEPAYNRNFTPRNNRPADTSWYDDGYSSSAADAREYRGFGETPLYSTLLLPEVESPTTDVSDSELTQMITEGACPISYQGATFDATKFGIVEMRQFTCDSGIAHSSDEMHAFIEFLAAKAEELENDPKWKNVHSLGKSEDWLSLKGLL